MFDDVLWKKHDFISNSTFIQTQTFHHNQNVLQMHVTQKTVNVLELLLTVLKVKYMFLNNLIFGILPIWFVPIIFFIQIWTVYGKHYDLCCMTSNIWTYF